MMQQGVLDPMSATVFMQFQPVWDYVDRIREFCGFFCHTTLSNAQITERVQVIVQELLENAIKYSEKKDVNDVQIEMRLERNHQEFTIAVMNQGTPQMVESLQQEIATIAAMSPEEAYSQAIRRAARSDRGTTSNRLGIARLRCDGQVELSAHLMDDGRIRVEAKGTK